MRVIGIDLRDAEVIADLSEKDGRSRAISETLDLCGGVLEGVVTSAGVGPPFESEKNALYQLVRYSRPSCWLP